MTDPIRLTAVINPECQTMTAGFESGQLYDVRVPNMGAVYETANPAGEAAKILSGFGFPDSAIFALDDTQGGRYWVSLIGQARNLDPIPKFADANALNLLA